MGALEQGAGAIEKRWLMTARTLSFVTCDGYVLLLKRAAHKRVFPNKYNGLGGFVERDEDVLTSARREIIEECGLNIDHPRLVAIHHIDTSEQAGIMLWVFVGEIEQRSTLINSYEGVLEWVKLEELNQYDLVEDLPHILPRYLEHFGAPLFAHVSYGADDQIKIRYAEG